MDFDLDKIDFEERAVNLPDPKNPNQIKTLIFDLDGTLAHCVETEDDSVSHGSRFDPTHQHKVPITMADGELIEATINVRPYIKECLSQCS